MNDIYKQKAAEAAMVELRQGMRIGLGTGSTAAHFVKFLGARVKEGFECICVPTSKQTAEQARELGIPLSDLEQLESLDLTVDGADELNSELSLIKGGGGALLREKIVAATSNRLVIIADQSKLVDRLGEFPLPVEVNEFGQSATRRALAALMKKQADGEKLLTRKSADGSVFKTDGGHIILDAFFGRILDARALSRALLDIPGVVQHGLFLDMCSTAYIAGPGGVKKLQA